MAKPNHHSLSYKQQAQPNKTYKDLKQKQKAKIADWMYRETLRFYLQNGRMPQESECDALCRIVFQKITGQAIWVSYEEVLRQFLRKQEDYAPRILAAVESGITEKDLERPKKAKKDVPAKKSKPHRKKVKQPPMEDPWQDDQFFFIAGYTSGGAPYGVTWEEMGLSPYEDFEE